MSNTPWGSPKKVSEENENESDSEQSSESGGSSPWGGAAKTSSDSQAPTSTPTPSSSPTAGSNEAAAYVTGDNVITQISIKPYQSGALQAFVDINFFGHYVMKGFKVMDGRNGLWVAMPSQKDDNTGEWLDTFHPITKKGREKIFSIVLEIYKKQQNGELPSGEEVQPMNLGTAPGYSTEPPKPGVHKGAPNTPVAGNTADLPFWKRLILKFSGVEIPDSPTASTQQPAISEPSSEQPAAESPTPPRQENNSEAKNESANWAGNSTTSTGNDSQSWG